MELRMSPENIQAALPVIGFNYDELKAELAERLQHYNGLVVTEDTIKDAKTDRANLNKLRAAIDTRRKEVKKAYMVPYNNFEAQCKELTALIDEPIKVIDDQLNEFDERRKQEKLTQVRDEYESLIPEAQKDIIPFDRIFDKRWLNSTMSILKVQDALRDWSKRVGADLIAMDAVDQEYRAAVRQKYIETLDIQKAIGHVEALKAAQAAFERRQAEQAALAEKRAQEAEMRRQEAEKRAQEAAAAQQQAQAQQPQQPEQAAPHLNRLILEFAITRDQAIALKDFLDQNGIKYRKYTA